MTHRRKLLNMILTRTLLAVMVAAAAMPASANGEGGSHPGLGPNTRFYTPTPNPDAIRQIARLLVHRQRADAQLMTQMIATPQAVWVTGGTPQGVKQEVKKVVTLATVLHTVPILVAYNIPFRDCAQFSAAGPPRWWNTMPGSTPLPPGLATPRWL